MSYEERNYQSGIRQAYPKQILKTLLLSYPEIVFHIRYYDEHYRWARDFVLTKGKETQKQKRPAKDIASEVEAFRGAAFSS